MTRALATLAAGATVVAIFGAGCGKKGAPLPPLRPDPARIADLSVRAVDGFLDVSFVAPAANADGTTPSIIDAVELSALAGTATPTPPAPTPP
ncbi:MAG TPA: hypothetical protein VMM93_02035, partial [Vicinamibacterales bacterium]|nr:hypothetical protein [Vicinamibacterales bacterium]